MKQNYSILSIIVLIVTIVIIPLVTFAGAEHNVTGFAWANMPNPNDEKQTTNGSCHPTAADYGKNHIGCGQGLGWISLNSTNQAGSVNYGVNLSENGTFIGNGWSPYGGWLNFNPTSGFPAGPSYSAKVDPTCLVGATACPVTGWIRFTAGGSAQSGGWDGWVKMSGNGYGVTVSAPNPAGVRTMTGYAWGDEVVGWIKFDAKIKDEIIPVDVCPNLAGSQPTVPDGYGVENGQCLQKQKQPYCGDPKATPPTGSGYMTPAQVAARLAQLNAQNDGFIWEMVRDDSLCIICPPGTKFDIAKDQCTTTPPPDYCENISGDQSGLPTQGAPLIKWEEETPKLCIPYACKTLGKIGYVPEDTITVNGTTITIRSNSSMCTTTEPPNNPKNPVIIED